MNKNNRGSEEVFVFRSKMSKQLPILVMSVVGVFLVVLSSASAFAQSNQSSRATIPSVAITKCHSAYE